jgi:N-succinyldiaminopimelate aminotransferase
MTVLPGNYLSRSVDGIDPGYDRVRIALVSTLDECREAAERILEFLNK